MSFRTGSCSTASSNAFLVELRLIKEAEDRIKQNKIAQVHERIQSIFKEVKEVKEGNLLIDKQNFKEIRSLVLLSQQEGVLSETVIAEWKIFLEGLISVHAGRLSDGTAASTSIGLLAEIAMERIDRQISLFWFEKVKPLKKELSDHEKILFNRVRTESNDLSLQLISSLFLCVYPYTSLNRTSMTLDSNRSLMTGFKNFLELKDEGAKELQVFLDAFIRSGFQNYLLEALVELPKVKFFQENLGAIKLNSICNIILQLMKDFIEEIKEDLSEDSPYVLLSKKILETQNSYLENHRLTALQLIYRSNCQCSSSLIEGGIRIISEIKDIKDLNQIEEAASKIKDSSLKEKIQECVEKRRRVLIIEIPNDLTKEGYITPFLKGLKDTQLFACGKNEFGELSQDKSKMLGITPVFSDIPVSSIQELLCRGRYTLIMQDEANIFCSNCKSIEDIKIKTLHKLYFDKQVLSNTSHLKFKQILLNADGQFFIHKESLINQYTASSDYSSREVATYLDTSLEQIATDSRSIYYLNKEGSLSTKFYREWGMQSAHLLDNVKSIKAHSNQLCAKTKDGQFYLKIVVVDLPEVAQALSEEVISVRKFYTLEFQRPCLNPIELPQGYKITKVFLGGRRVFILSLHEETHKQALFGFGKNSYGELGLEPTHKEILEMTRIPTEEYLSAGEKILGIHCGLFHTILETTKGFYGFGSNAQKQLGFEDTAHTQLQFPPRRLKIKNKFIQKVTVGDYQTFFWVKRSESVKEAVRKIQAALIEFIYRPGGPGYLRTKEHFNDLASQFNTSQEHFETK